MLMHMHKEEEKNAEFSSKDILSSITTIIQETATQHIGKKRVYYQYHLTRSEKEERKLRKKIALFTRRHKR